MRQGEVKQGLRGNRAVQRWIDKDGRPTRAARNIGRGVGGFVLALR